MRPHRVSFCRAVPAFALALASLSFSALSSAQEHETELVTWGSATADTWGFWGDDAGGAERPFGARREVGLGIMGEGHLGIGYRFGDSPQGKVIERAGFIFGGSVFVRPLRHAAIGIGYSHLDLGQDRDDLPPDQFRDVERDLNSLWIQLRAYPLRLDAVSFYLGLGTGPTWQSLDTSVASVPSGSVTNVVTSTCAGNDSAKQGGRLSLGAEVPLKHGLVLTTEAGADVYNLSGDMLDGCAVGADTSYLFAARLGFAYGLEVAKKRAKPQAPPPPPPDRDRDGVVDAYDACPDVPGFPNNDPAKNGCPPPKDTDGDSFIDELDACVTVPGVANKDPAKNGCPLKDTDNDGVLDDDDACVEIPGIKTADPKTNGCPPDTDGDGFRDDKDGCPTEKGVANEDPAKNGCPTVQVTRAEIVINEQVQFDTDKATIKAVSDPLLDSVARTIKEHPEFLKIEVQGHTDDQGPRNHNLILSQSRADAVRKALIKRGIQWDRFAAKGYGPDVPIADNTTDEGRSKNRRVQFKIVQRKDDAAGDKKPADHSGDKKPADHSGDVKPTGGAPAGGPGVKPTGGAAIKPQPGETPPPRPVGSKPDGKL